jgi:alkanesulfonate monooxygenase SsuD/methylene tetrahydromethanopterin reductase-like flavin-dependent oxidoreductase (luciferase family)
LKAFLDESCTGTPETIAKELNAYIERGAELIILWFQDLADVGSGTSMPERFMKEVKPLLKKGA